MKQVLIYDINVLPEGAGLDAERLMYLYKEHQFVVWDSEKATEGQDCKPQIVNVEEGTEVAIVDYQTVRDFKDIKRILSECVDKELIKEMIEFANKK